MSGPSSNSSHSSIFDPDQDKGKLLSDDSNPQAKTVNNSLPESPSQPPGLLKRLSMAIGRKTSKDSATPTNTTTTTTTTTIPNNTVTNNISSSNATTSLDSNQSMNKVSLDSNSDYDYDYERKAELNLKKEKIYLAFLSWTNEILKSKASTTATSIEATSTTDSNNSSTNPVLIDKSSASSISTLSALSDGVQLIAITEHLFPSSTSMFSSSSSSTSSSSTSLISSSDSSTDKSISASNSSALPTPQSQRKQNLSTLIEYLEQNFEVDNLNTTVDDISSGNQDAIIVILQLLLDQHVKQILIDKLAALSSPQQLRHLSLHAQLLAWVNSSCRSASESAVSNWTDDWKDGTALLDVIHTLAPASGIMDSHEQFDDSRQERVDQSLKSAQRLFGILPPFDSTDLFVVTPTSIQSKRNATRHLTKDDLPLFVEMLLSASTIQHQSISIAQANRSVAWSGVKQNLKETAAPDMEKAEALEQNITAIADQAFNQFAKTTNYSTSENQTAINDNSSDAHSANSSSRSNNGSRSSSDVDLLPVPSPTVTSHLSSTGQTVHPFAHVEESGTALPTSATVSSTHVSVPVNNNATSHSTPTQIKLSALSDNTPTLEEAKKENTSIKSNYPYAETQ